jgi:hypothetical protein
MGTLLKEGWLPLHSGAEVHLSHGIPDRAWVKGNMPPAGDGLAREILDVTGLHVRIGDWLVTDPGFQFEAPLTVLREDLPEVLRRLAMASAQTYYDRFHQPMSDEDTDWDTAAFAQDFDAALHACGLHWGEVDEDKLRSKYCDVMHETVQRLTAGETPLHLG